jgi:cytidyltransferase-like protein
MTKVVLITGGFDIIHSGHIQYINGARKLAGKTGKVIVGLNSDAWLKSKKDFVALNVEERATILESIEAVDQVIEFDDSDGTAIDAIEQVKKQHPKATIIFANGGDRTKDNIPEMKAKGVTFKFGIGGKDKPNSSSHVIFNAMDQLKEPVKRKWGSYSILYDRPECKVKELMIEPGKGISLQKHEIRSETWQIICGNFELGTGKSKKVKKSKLQAGDIVTVPFETWHVLTNVGNYTGVLIEIQSGSQCIETDIIRA